MNEPTAPRCTTITPIVPVKDLSRALEFYTSVLGFVVQARDDGYAYIVKDGVALRLLKATDDKSSGQQQACYICVEDLDGLYEQMRPALEQLNGL